MQEVKVVVLTLTRARMGVVVETQKPGDGKTFRSKVRDYISQK